MAVSSNRSPSPITTRPNANPRTPEVNNPIRRSFNGNPFTKPSIVANPRSFNPTTPANSPSDFGRRNSIDNGVVSLHEYEQKENEKDNNLKPARVRSPAVSKSTKNFMSPTISAASKITTASPRKKVLVERNEPIRTSVSFSDGRSPFTFSSTNLSDVAEDTDSKPQMGSIQKKVSFSDGKAPLSSMNISDVAEDTDSKLQTGSNRKKVSFSDGLGPLGSVNHSDVAEDTDSRSEMGSNQKKMDASCVTTSADSDHKQACIGAIPIPRASKSDTVDTESVSTITVEPECGNGNARFKISPSPSCSSCPVLSPLDLDPSLPPYDPKKNYLSPRPQFLHYKPNPRIEVYLNKERVFDSEKGKCLEDSFILESFSDTENTDETQSEDSQKESEDASSVEMLKEEEEGPHDFEPNFIKAVEAKGVSKPHFLARSKSISLLLIFIIACLSISVTDSPVIGPSVFKDQTFFKLYDPSEFAQFAKANSDGLARIFKLWSANSISYFSKLFPILRDVDKFGPLHFANLTASSNDLLVDGYFSIDSSNKVTEESHQQNELGPIREEEVEIGSLEEKGHPKIGADDKMEEASERHNDQEFEEQEHLEIETDGNDEEVLEEHENPEVQEQLQPTREAEVIEPVNSEAEEILDKSDLAFHVDQEFEEQEHLEIETDGNDEEVLEELENPEVEEQVQLTQEAEVIEPDNSEAEEILDKSDLAFHVEIGDQSAIISQASDIQPEVSEELRGENDLNSCAKAESIAAEVNPENSELDVSYGNSQSLKTLDFPLNGSEDKFSLRNMLGISLLVLTSIAATAFIHAKKGEKTSNPNAAIPINQLPAKKLISSPVTVSIEHTYQERLSSRNWPTEVDMVGKSCLSEMSSFQKSSSYSKKGTNEVQSYERKPRKNSKRESLASSSDYSTGLPSYGSFTTCERINSKHGEEETITPVRRSSRIRNHITSP